MSLLNITIISSVVEPNTLRIPISFFRYSLSNTTKPNTPTTEIKIAIKLNEGKSMN